jgi:hypothetical protein
VLEARARESNEELGSGKERVTDKDVGQVRDAGQEPDLTAMNVARVWGDLLGAEVTVRTLRGRKFRLEVVFDSAAEGIVLDDRLAAAIARGSKRR